jgi:hypothetical protein
MAASHTHPIIAGVGVRGVGRDHPLPTQREEAEVKENGQAHAEQDAEHYPEQATPTQRLGAFVRPSPSRTPRLP